MRLAIPYMNQNNIKIDMTPEYMVGGFCDWISVSQDHGIELKQPSKNHYLLVDTTTGEVEEIRHNAVFVEGSYSTTIRVQVNGGRVSLSGNVGRFGRPDNLFGYSLDKVKLLVNEFIVQLGLPPFSAGVFYRIETKKGSTLTYTGAKISRLDICTNYCAGKYHGEVIDNLSTKHISRTKSKTFGDSDTIQWGNTLRTTKVYRKHSELRAHNRNKLSYIRELAEWCEEQGIVRHETKFTEKYLNRNNLKAWCRCTDENIFPHYRETKNILDQTMEIQDTRDMPSYLLGTYHAYTNGMNMQRLSKATFYRHRKELINYGIDIAVPNNTVKMKPQTRVITLTEPVIPDFYNLTNAA